MASPAIDASTGRSGWRAHENVAAFNLLSPERQRPLLVDLRELKAAVDRDARLYYAGPEIRALSDPGRPLAASPTAR
jgi:hypothetical protein